MRRPSYLRSIESEKKIMEELSDRLFYDPFSGAFIYKKNVGKNKKPFDIAGTVNKSTRGYRKIVLFKKQVCAHRLAWFMFYGEIPSMCIDHIDGNRDNNSISNLRVVDENLNQQNRPEHRIGVLWGTSKVQGGKYFSSRVHGKYLGNFKTMNAAHKKAVEYANKNGIKTLKEI